MTRCDSIDCFARLTKIRKVFVGGPSLRNDLWRPATETVSGTLGGELSANGVETLTDTSLTEVGWTCLSIFDTTLIQVRKFRYQEIAAELRQQTRTNDLAPGQVLPSEAALGEQFRASRVTIRRALEILRDEGLVESRQGFGWMVAATPFAQPLDELVPIERQLEKSGQQPERKIIDFNFRSAPNQVAPILGERVLEVRRLNLVDGAPFAVVIVWCREDLGLDLSHSQLTESSFYDVLAIQPVRAVQSIAADLMSESDAELLGVPKLTPALVVRRTTYGPADEPLLMSNLVFPGHLTEFVAELETSVGDQPRLRLLDSTALSPQTGS